MQNDNLTMNNGNQNAIKEMLKSFAYLLEETLKKTTQNYDGLILSDAGSGKWNVQINGEVHAIKPYGSVVPAPGKLVKVFIPQGNMSVAYFI